MAGTEMESEIGLGSVDLQDVLFYQEEASLDDDLRILTEIDRNGFLSPDSLYC